MYTELISASVDYLLLRQTTHTVYQPGRSNFRKDVRLSRSQSVYARVTGKTTTAEYNPEYAPCKYFCLVNTNKQARTMQSILPNPSYPHLLPNPSCHATPNVSWVLTTLSLVPSQVWTLQNCLMGHWTDDWKQRISPLVVKVEWLQSGKRQWRGLAGQKMIKRFSI